MALLRVSGCFGNTVFHQNPFQLFIFCRWIIIVWWQGISSPLVDVAAKGWIVLFVSVLVLHKIKYHLRNQVEVRRL